MRDLAMRLLLVTALALMAVAFFPGGTSARAKFTDL